MLGRFVRELVLVITAAPGPSGTDTERERLSAILSSSTQSAVSTCLVTAPQKTDPPVCQALAKRHKELETLKASGWEQFVIIVVVLFIVKHTQEIQRGIK